MKTPSIIFCIYHLFSVSLSIDLEIKTQRVKVYEHEKRRRPANIRTYVRVQKPTTCCLKLPPPPISAALRELPSPTLLTSLSIFVYFFLYSSMRFVPSPHYNVPKEEVSSTFLNTIPLVPRSMLGKQQLLSMSCSSPRIHTLNPLSSAPKQCRDNKNTSLGLVTYVSVPCLCFMNSSSCFLWLCDPFLQIQFPFHIPLRAKLFHSSSNPLPSSPLLVFQ